MTTVCSFRCQYWQPGRDRWEQTYSEHEHTNGGAASLGDGEVMLVGNKGDDEAITEILDKNGLWAEKGQNGVFPENLRWVESWKLYRRGRGHGPLRMS